MQYREAIKNQTDTFLCRGIRSTPQIPCEVPQKAWWRPTPRLVQGVAGANL